MWLFLSNVILWVLAYAFEAVQLRPTSLSDFELKRRAESGDGDAQELTKREELLPRLQALHRIVESILVVLATALTIVVFGWVLGTVIASALSLLLGTAGRVAPFATAVQNMYAKNEQHLLGLVEGWRWLEWFRGVGMRGHEVIATSKPELQYIIERSATVLTRDELLRFQASLTLDNHTVEDVMTPVSVVETADVKDALGPLVLDGLHKTGHSRFPVIDGDINHVVGILYLRDIINLRSTKATVKEAMDPRVHYIHENQTLEHALNGFLRTHHHLFVVVNDYRETVGVLALEDVIETLLGKKIVDEFDRYDDLRAVAESNPRKNNLPKGKTDI
jgi:CBS domain containing-hemolysin-like protein